MIRTGQEARTGGQEAGGHKGIWGEGRGELGEGRLMHTGNTRTSCMCVIEEYRFYTMSLSQYNGCCQYHETISIPSMSPCQYHESMSIP